MIEVNVFYVEQNPSGVLPIIFVLKNQDGQTNLYCIQDMQKILPEPFFVGDVLGFSDGILCLRLAFFPDRRTMAHLSLNHFRSYNASEFAKKFIPDSHKYIEIDKA